jgi:hypothetical protein
VDRSLRRLGQLLVAMGALLGAALGVGLALLVENAETSRAVAGPGPERGAALAAGPPGSRPPASRAASSPGPGNAGDASGDQRARSAGQGGGRADKQGQGRDDKPGKANGTDRPGKGKDKDK